MKPDDVAKRLLEIANTTEAGPDGRIDVGQVNIIFLREGGKPDDYRAGIEWLKADGMIDMHPRRHLLSASPTRARSGLPKHNYGE